MKLFKQLLLKIFVLILFSTKAIYAQVNLVPNPSFEVYDTCPSAILPPYLGIEHAIPWFQPYLLGSSTDYFNSCNLDTIFSVSTPHNYEGYQLARTGVAYAGFITGYIVPQNNYREYLEVRLNDTLLSGKKYCVSFYVSFANVSRRATDGLEAYFSNNQLVYISPQLGLITGIQPQVQNPVGNVITDTLNWVNISGSFYAAGGEKYITIGNFRPDSSTTMIQNNYGIHYYSYCYIDDVSVIYCDVDAGINEGAIKDFTISPNPAKDILTLNNLPNTNMELFLFDVHGRVCKHLQSITGSSIKTIDLTGLINGMYFIKIVTKNGTIAKKFVKE